MTSEIRVQCRDSIRIPLLREILDRRVRLLLRVGNAAPEDYASAVHQEGSRMRVIGKFNVSESPTGDVLTVRPVAAEEPLVLQFAYDDGAVPPDRKLLLVRAVGKQTAGEWELNGLASAELLPVDGNFLLQVRTRSRETAAQETVPPDTDGSNPSASEPAPQSEAEKRRILAEEMQKDHTAARDSLEDIKARVEADEAVLAYYRDKDVKPTETLLQEIHARIEEAETQIRLLIEAREKKAAAIEGEIKRQRREGHG